ncbi:MAG TPA: hypothetical protein VJO33_16820 [Gemmatimonadaceae bacterium]|nr:hypothetical protein [Gemmatimonadaceae bacterium]
MRKLSSTVAVLVFITAFPLGAQGINAAVAYGALITTPAGALPPVLSDAMLNRSMTQPDVAVRYGHISDAGTSLNTFDARVGFPFGTRAMVGVNAGYQDASCSFGNCDSHFIAGANAEGRLASSMLGTGAEAAQLTIGLNGDAGFGKNAGATAFSFTGGLPVALLSRTSKLLIAPFLTPAFGWGRASDNGVSENGTRFLLGGGVTVQSLNSPIGANFGFQKVFIDGGETVFGVSLVVGRR